MIAIAGLPKGFLGSARSGLNNGPVRLNTRTLRPTRVPAGKKKIGVAQLSIKYGGLLVFAWMGWQSQSRSARQVWLMQEG